MKVSNLELTAIILAGITGLIHLYYILLIGLSPLGIGFLVAGIGFFAGIWAIIKDYDKRIYLIGIPFIAGQIILWYFINGLTLETALRPELTLAKIDKLAQVILICVSGLLYRRES